MAETMSDLVKVLACGNCGDLADRHAAFTGPCADCWERMESICERFRLRDEDRDRVELAAPGAAQAARELREPEAAE